MVSLWIWQVCVPKEKQERRWGTNMCKSEKIRLYMLPWRPADSAGWSFHCFTSVRWWMVGSFLIEGTFSICWRCEILCSRCLGLKFGITRERCDPVSRCIQSAMYFSRGCRGCEVLATWAMSSGVRRRNKIAWQLLSIYPIYLSNLSGSSDCLCQGFGYCTDERHCVNSLSLVCGAQCENRPYTRVEPTSSWLKEKPV